MNNIDPTSSMNRRQLLQMVGAFGIGTSFTERTEALNNREQVEYSELTEKARRIFRLNLETGRSHEYRYEDFPSQLVKYEVVVYQGNQYLLNQNYRNRARFRLAPEVINPDELGPYDKRDLVRYDELSPDAVTAFLTALQSGTYEQFGGFPPEFEFQNRYVYYHGDYYDLGFLHEDIPLFTIAPSLVED